MNSTDISSNNQSNVKITVNIENNYPKNEFKSILNGFNSEFIGSIILYIIFLKNDKIFPIIKYPPKVHLLTNLVIYIMLYFSQKFKSYW